MATLSVSNEYLSWDNTESLTVNLKTASGYGDNITVGKGLRLDIDLRRQVFNGVRLEAGQLFFWLPVAQVGAGELNANAKITDASGTVYYILTSVKRGLGSSASHWECLCVRASA